MVLIVLVQRETAESAIIQQRLHQSLFSSVCKCSWFKQKTVSSRTYTKVQQQTNCCILFANQRRLLKQTLYELQTVVARSNSCYSMKATCTRRCGVSAHKSSYAFSFAKGVYNALKVLGMYGNLPAPSYLGALMLIAISRPMSNHLGSCRLEGGVDLLHCIAKVLTISYSISQTKDGDRLVFQVNACKGRACQCFQSYTVQPSRNTQRLTSHMTSAIFTFSVCAYL